MNETTPHPADNPQRDDVVVWALGALEGDDAARVERAVADDAALQTEAARIREHLAAYDALPPAPPPPPFVHVDQAVSAAQGRRLRRRHNRFVIAGLVAAALLVGLSVWVWTKNADRVSWRQPTTVIAGEGWQTYTRVDRPVFEQMDGGPFDARAGTRLRANEPAELRWQSAGRGIHLIADAGSAVEWMSAEHVELVSGRARFEVEPARTLDSSDFVVSVKEHRVRVVGTVFVVDADARRVEVLRGNVEVDDTPVADAQTWSGGAVTARAPGGVGWLPRPTLTLGQERGRGDDDVFSLTFHNASAVTVDLPAPEGNRTGLWMEWLDDRGQRLKSLPVRPQALEGDREWLRGNRSVGLPPRAERTIWIRFRAADRPVGAYRCRALVRPAGAPPVLSNSLGLEER